MLKAVKKYRFVVFPVALYVAVVLLFILVLINQ